MIRILKAVSAALLALALLSTAVAGEKKPDTPSDKKEIPAAEEPETKPEPGKNDEKKKENQEEKEARAIRELIKTLGSKNWKERSEAMKSLLDYGDKALPYLLEAAQSDNPEIRTRAENLMEKIAWNVGEEVEKRFKKQVDTFRNMHARNRKNFVNSVYRTLKNKSRQFMEKVFLYDQDPEVRLAAVRNLAAIENKTVPALIGEYKKKFPMIERGLLLVLGDHYRTGKKPSLALEHYEKALSLGKVPDETRRWMADLYKDSGKPEKAVELLETMIARAGPAPKKKFLYMDLITLLVETGKLEKAQDFFKKAAEEYPRESAIYSAAIEAFWENDHVDKALEICKKAIEVFPGRYDFPETLAAMHVEANRLEEAVALYEKIVAQQGANTPTGRRILKQIGELQLLAGDEKKAFATWDRILGANPSAGEYDYAARIFLSNGFPKKAEEIVKTGLEKHEKNTQLMGVLADLYISRGSPEKILDLFKKIDVPESESGEYLLALDNYIHGPEKKLERIRKNYSSNPADPGEMESLYRELLIHGKDAEAAQVLVKSATRMPESPAVKTLMADSFFEHGRYEAARQIYQELVRNSGGDESMTYNLYKCFAAQGLDNRALEIVEKLEQSVDNRFSPWIVVKLVQFRAERGEFDKIREIERNMGEPSTLPFYKYILKTDVAEAARDNADAALHALDACLSARSVSELDEASGRLEYLLKIKSIRKGVPAALESKIAGSPVKSEKLRALEKLVRFYRLTGNVSEAAKTAGRIVDAGLDKNMKYEIERARLLMHSGDTKTAREILEKARKKDTSNPVPVLLLGRIKELGGTPPDKIEEYEKAFKLRGRDELTFIETAEAFYEKGEYALAKLAWRKIVEFTSDDFLADLRAYEGLGADALENGDLDRAGKFFRMFIFLADLQQPVVSGHDHDRVAAMYDYLRALEQLEKKENEKALAFLNRSLKRRYKVKVAEKKIQVLESMKETRGLEETARKLVERLEGELVRRPFDAELYPKIIRVLRLAGREDETNKYEKDLEKIKENLVDK